MRSRDFIPLALLGGIACFIIVQGAEMGRARNARRAMRAADSVMATLAQQGQQVQDPSRGVAPSARRAIDDLPPAELRASEEPAPVRDDSVVRQQIKENATGTYILAILEQQQQMLLRWPQRQRDALRVYIAREANVPDWNTSYPLVAENVFDEWKKAGFPLRFDFVTDPVGADVEITWIERFAASDDLRIGRTTKARDQSGWLVEAEIVVATHTPDGAGLSAEVVAGVIRHEVGHALGLGHSGSTSDVMYPESRTNSISDADRATLHLLYMLPPGVVK